MVVLRADALSNLTPHPPSQGGNGGSEPGDEAISSTGRLVSAALVSSDALLDALFDAGAAADGPEAQVVAGGRTHFLLTRIPPLRLYMLVQCHELCLCTCMRARRPPQSEDLLFWAGQRLSASRLLHCPMGIGIYCRLPGPNMCRCVLFTFHAPR